MTSRMLFLFAFLITFVETFSQQPENLMVIGSLDEIIIEPAGAPQMRLITLEPGDGVEGRVLRITCQATPDAPSIYFKSLAVAPTQTYTFFVDAAVHDSTTAFVQVVSKTTGKIVVWPGARLVNGITRQVITVPDGAPDMAVGFAIVSPRQAVGVDIRHVGLYAGDITADKAKILEDESLQPLLKRSSKIWWWVLFPLAGIVLLYLHFKGKRLGQQPDDESTVSPT